MKQRHAHKLILIQAIDVWWTKSSRGAPGAVARNRVREGYLLPSIPPRAPETLAAPNPMDEHALEIYVHHVSYGETNQFQEPLAQSWIVTSQRPEASALRLPDRHVPPLSLAETHSAMQVSFSWHEIPGEPRRHHLHLRERVVLETGQWMRVRFNARHTDSDGDWYYEKHALNIGVVETFTPNAFLTCPPDYYISDMANLH